MTRELKHAEVTHECSQHTGIDYLTQDECRHRIRKGLFHDEIWCRPCQKHEKS